MMSRDTPREPMKTLDQTIAEATEHFKGKWANQREAAEQFRDTPEGERVVAAQVIIKERLPRFVTGPADRLRERVHLKLLEAAMKWTPASHSLALVGPTRTGKTTAAGLLFRKHLAKAARAGGGQWWEARRMRWAHAARLAKAYRTHRLGSEPPIVEEACSASILVLDDLGWDRDGDNATVGNVLNARYESELPTIITSGLTQDELLEHYGDAVFRKVFDAGGEGRIVSVFKEGKKT